MAGKYTNPNVGPVGKYYQSQRSKQMFLHVGPSPFSSSISKFWIQLSHDKQRAVGMKVQ